MSSPLGTLGKGTTIGHASAQAGPFTAFAKVMGVKPPPTKVGKAETTCFDDAAEQFIPAFISAGEGEFKLLYQTATTTTAYALVGVLTWFQITLPDTHTWTFQGFIDDYAPDVPLKEGIVENVKITVTGQPVYA